MFRFLSYRRWSRGHKTRGQGQGHKKIWGQGQPFRGQTLSRPRTALPRTDTFDAKDRNARGQGQGNKRKMCSPKKKFFKNFFRRSPTTKKSSKLFSRDLQKNGLEKNFSAHLQNFNHSKDSAVLEPRTGQFSRTWGFEAKDFKMCPRGQGRPRGLHLCLLYWTRRWE